MIITQTHPTPLLHIQQLTKISGNIYLAPCPHSQEHAKGPNEEETIVPHLYAVTHYLLISRHEARCSTPSAADSKHAFSCLRQRERVVLQTLFLQLFLTYQPKSVQVQQVSYETELLWK